jgi:hypothetical protein
MEFQGQGHPFGESFTARAPAMSSVGFDFGADSVHHCFLHLGEGKPVLEYAQHGVLSSGFPCVWPFLFFCLFALLCFVPRGEDGTSTTELHSSPELSFQPMFHGPAQILDVLIFRDFTSKSMLTPTRHIKYKFLL